jgi:hypothetical protein
MHQMNARKESGVRSYVSYLKAWYWGWNVV